jgi:hypothetical protein
MKKILSTIKTGIAQIITINLAELNWALGDFLSNNLFYKNTFLHIFEKSYYWMIKQTGLEWLSNKKY